MSYYRGFSTIDFSQIGVLNNAFPTLNVVNYAATGMFQKTLRYVSNSSNLTLTDIQLVEQNLINNIFTRKGERIRQSKFGTSIPDLIYEPMDTTTINKIESEIKAVIAYDPRVALRFIKTTPNYDTHSVLVSASLYYVEMNITNGFELNIEFAS